MTAPESTVGISNISLLTIPFFSFCIQPMSIPSVIWTSRAFGKSSSFSPLNSSPGHWGHPNASSASYLMAWMYISNALKKTLLVISIFSPLCSRFRSFLLLMKASIDFPCWLVPKSELKYSFRRSTLTKCTLLCG